MIIENGTKKVRRWYPPYPHWLDDAKYMGAKERRVQAALGIATLYSVGLCGAKGTYTVDVYATEQFDAWVYATKVIIPQPKWKKLGVYTVGHIDKLL